MALASIPETITVVKRVKCSDWSRQSHRDLGKSYPGEQMQEGNGCCLSHCQPVSVLVACTPLTTYIPKRHTLDWARMISLAWKYGLKLSPKRNISPILLCSISGGLQIKLTKDKVTREWPNFICARVHRRMWLKVGVRIWGLYSILIGEGGGRRTLTGNKWSFGKSNGPWGEQTEDSFVTLFKCGVQTSLQCWGSTFPGCLLGRRILLGGCF